MSQDSKALSFALPLIIVLLLVQEAADGTQTVVAAILAIAAIAFTHFGARFVWPAFFRRIGFWRASALLVAGIASVCAIAMILGGTLHVAYSALKLPVSAITIGLLFSWGLAALENASEKKA
jgi:predicted permease